MIEKLVALALRTQFIVFVAVIVVVGMGLFAYKNLDIEAYPNPVPPLVEVITQPGGLSGEEVERSVTVPIEVGLSGMPGLDHIRSQSLF
ncbi:MAG TPA: efflux RND transporter permease subunit, partial [Polyangiaceae bacterium]